MSLRLKNFIKYSNVFMSERKYVFAVYLLTYIIIYLLFFATKIELYFSHMFGGTIGIFVGYTFAILTYIFLLFLLISTFYFLDKNAVKKMNLCCEKCGYYNKDKEQTNCKKCGHIINKT